MEKILIGSIVIVLSFIMSFITPVVIGTQMSDEKSMKEGNLGRILNGTFKKFDNLGSIFSKVHTFIKNIIKRFYVYNDDEKSFKSLITIFITIGILTGVYFVIGKIMFNEIYDEIKNIILDNLANNTLSIKLILSIIIDGLSTLIELFKIEYWYIKIFMFIFISILYVAIIYYGLKEENQIYQGRKISKFNLKVLTIKNIIILSLFVSIFFLITSNIPVIDIISTVLLVLSIFNIEISITTTAITVGTILTEKAVKKVIVSIRKSSNLKDSHIFK